MRLLHTADWHLGQDLYGFDRTAEHQAFLDWLGGLITQEQPDALLVAGDVFHSVNPSVRAQRLFFAFLAQLRREHPNLDVVIVGGNHDSPARLELAAALIEDARLTIVGAAPWRKDLGGIDVAGMIAPLTDRDGNVAAACIALPFLRPGDLGAQAEDGTAAVEALYAEAARAAKGRHPGVPLIATGHLTVLGGAISEVSERRILIGGAEAAPLSIFPNEACYVALGHLHRPQTVRAEPLVRYAGSPFPLSVTERDYAHSVSLVEIDGEDARLTEISAPRPADFLRAPETGAFALDALEEGLAQLAPSTAPPELAPFLEVVVQLDAPAPDLRQRIDRALEGAKMRLARIVRMRGAEDRDEAEDEVALSSLTTSETFDRLCGDRLGAPPSAEMLQAFELLLTEVETDADLEPSAPQTAAAP